MSQLPTPSPTPVREAEPKEDRLADVKVPVLKDEPTIANLKPKITALAREAAEAQSLSKKTKKATEHLEDKVQKVQQQANLAHKKRAELHAEHRRQLERHKALKEEAKELQEQVAASKEDWWRRKDSAEELVEGQQRLEDEQAGLEFEAILEKRYPEPVIRELVRRRRKW